MINGKPKPSWGPAWALAVATGLVVTLMAIPSSYAADTDSGAQTGDVTSVAAAEKASERQARRKYTPRTGAKFNHPLRPKLRRNINTHILKTIQAVPKGGKIRALSWNVRSGPYRRALINAHKRGVSVRILMSRAVASRQAPNQDYGILRREFSKKNKKRPKAMKSWMRSCKASCRGPSGIAHAKWFIFSDAGKADWVVISGSANLTEVAANNQWNDMYTVVGNRKLYGHFNHVFAQAAKDKTAHPSYVEYPMGAHSSAWFLPYRGKGADGDPVMKVLRPIKCAGANNHSGINGKTSIRIAQTAILDERGQEIAKRLKYLHNHGCNIRIVYTVLGPDVRSILRRDGGHGAVPMQQVAQDFDDDGSFDRYLHMKAMAISGHYGRSTSTHLVYNGSQNWTAVSFASDEAGFTINSDGLERKYGSWINGLFLNPPPNPNPRTVRSVPWSVRYSEVELD